MRVRRTLFLAVTSAAAIAGGCSTNVTLPWDSTASGTSTTPPGSATPPSPTPSPTQDLILASGSPRINDCVPISGVSGTDVTTIGVPPAQKNDLVLLWQTIETLHISGSGGPTPVASPVNAGHFELKVVSSVAGNTVTVDSTVLYAFGLASGKGQLCRVPNYGTVNIGGSAQLKADPWTANSGTGGIVAFVGDDVTLDGSINLKGMGFSGGPANATSSQVLSFGSDVDCASGAGAHKGEGIGGIHPMCGRAFFATGGGGGNAISAGGGGGGNYGHGGNGLNAPSNTNTEGLAGAGFLVASSNLVLGGGGGGGHNGPMGSSDGDGAPGGGVIFIIANTFKGTGSLRVNGDDAINVTDDGAGGGGGAGTIYLRVKNSPTFSGPIAANGGNGGSVTVGTKLCPGTVPYGAGGGGAGGRFIQRGPNGTLPPPSLAGGQGGGASGGGCGPGRAGDGQLGGSL